MLMRWFKLFLSLHVAGIFPPSFCSRGYMVLKMLVEEIQDGCLVLGNLWYANGMIKAISESACCQKPPNEFLLKRIYGLEENVGWRIPKWLFNAGSSFIILMEWFQLLCVTYLPAASHQVSAQEDIWFGKWWCFKNSKMAVIARQSLKCKWDDLSYFWVSMLLEAFNKVSAQEDIWFKRRCWLKNSKMAVWCLVIFDMWLWYL